MALRASVLGATGFSGAELLRHLGRHPALAPAAAGVRRAPDPNRLPHLLGTEIPLANLEQAAATEADVCFSCLPAGVLETQLDAIAAPVVIDLADDFRAEPEWVYGLTEFGRAEVAGATRIANPGCYPTAALLCLLPFAARGLIEGPLVVDALSGISGAGRKIEDRLLYAVAEGNAGAYGSVSHRHVPEIERGLAQFGSLTATVSFTPHLVPVARGLLVTARARLVRPFDDESALDVLRETYAAEPFVHVIPDWPQTKAVLGSNSAIVSARVDQRNGWLVASCAIDNLGKGAAGQAIQNANLALDLEETAGLETSGLWP